MIQIENTSLWKDVKKILDDGEKMTRYEYKAYFHTAKSNTEALKVISIDLVRDYLNSLADNIVIEFLLPLGTYIKKLYPYRNNLELTIYRRRLMEAGEMRDEGYPPELIRYKAVYMPEENKEITLSEYEAFDEFTLNLSEPINVKLQLLDRSIEVMRIKTTSGIFRDVDNESVLRSTIGHECKQFVLADSSSLDGIDIVEVDNKNVFKHVIIPDNTPIMHLPAYVQQKLGGVYNSGLGSYIQSYNNKLVWFIYSLYNTKRWTKSNRKLIIYSVPRHKLGDIERSYKTSGNVVYILGNSTKVYKSTGEASLMNKGGGFKLTDARAFMKKPVEITENGPVGHRDSINHEVHSFDRKDNLNHAPLSRNKISINVFDEASKIGSRIGAQIDFNWPHSNSNLIYPGMPCQFNYLDARNQVKQVNGIVLFAHHFTHLQNKGLASSSYAVETQLSLYVDPIGEAFNQTELEQ